ncbi:hypothetical protein [Actinomadura sp. NPDC049753]
MGANTALLAFTDGDIPSALAAPPRMGPPRRLRLGPDGKLHEISSDVL